MAAIAQLTVAFPEYCQTIGFIDGGAAFFTKYGLEGASIPYLYDPAEVPKKAYMTDESRMIADFTAINGRLAMCDEAREIIEKMEPGLHQFIPVMIVRGNGSAPIFRLDGRTLAEPYFLFNCQTRLDAVSLEDSEALVRNLPNGKFSVLRDRSKPNDKLVLSKMVIGNHHAWQGGLHIPSSLFFSEDLVNAIEEKNLCKLEFTHFSEV